MPPTPMTPLLRADWAKRRVTHSVTRVFLVVIWVFTLVWYGATLGAGWLLWTQPPRDGRGVTLAILAAFPVAGLLLVLVAIVATWSRARFKRSEFELDTAPFALGGCVSGVIRVPPAAARAQRFDLVLDCARVVVTSKSTFRSTIWREEATVPAAGLDRDATGIMVPVAIMVPADALPTGGEHRNRIEWKLSVAASLPGLDYEADFELPVFEGGGALPAPPRVLSRLRGQGEGQGWARPAGSRIRVVSLPDGIAIQYPTPSWLLPWTLGPLLLAPAGALVGRWAYPGELPAVLFGLGFGIMAAGFFLLLALLGILMHPNRVEVRGDTVVVRRGLFGRGWGRRIARSAVTSVKHIPVQNGPQVIHTVVLETREGNTCIVTPALRDLAEAKWLAAELERAVPPDPIA